MKILILDDDPLSLAGVRMVLEQRGGHACSTFRDPEAALKTFAAEPFDAVITDMRMPRLPGAEVLKAIKRLNPQMPVILMTGYIEQLDEAVIRAAHAYFLKPLRADELLEALNQIDPHQN
jgi:DNA-binding NtrC family response regulator